MKKIIATAAIALAAAFSTAPASAGTLWNGVQLNGAVWNGVQLNGAVWNGIKVNGLRLNGYA